MLRSFAFSTITFLIIKLSFAGSVSVTSGKPIENPETVTIEKPNNNAGAWEHLGNYAEEMDQKYEKSSIKMIAFLNQISQLLKGLSWEKMPSLFVESLPDSFKPIFKKIYAYRMSLKKSQDPSMKRELVQNFINQLILEIHKRSVETCEKIELEELNKVINRCTGPIL